MDQDLALALRERALSALEASTNMLTVAQNLLQQGNQREAVRLRNEARYKRNESSTRGRAAVVKHPQISKQENRRIIR